MIKSSTAFLCGIVLASVYVGLTVYYFFHTEPIIKEVIINKWPYEVQPFKFVNGTRQGLFGTTNINYPPKDAIAIQINIDSHSYYVIYVWPEADIGPLNFNWTYRKVIVP
jgi:hypothetical protein